MRDDINELKTRIDCLSAAFAERGTIHARENERLIMQADAAHRRLDILEPRVEKLDLAIRNELQTLKDAVGPLKSQARIITWVGVMLGGSMMALIWSIITGQVHLVFP